MGAAQNCTKARQMDEALWQQQLSGANEGGVTGTIVPPCTDNIIWDLIINNSYFIGTGNVAARCSRCTRKFPTSLKKAIKKL